MESAQALLLIPDRIFDGKEMHKNWQIIIAGDSILWVGEHYTGKIKTRSIQLPGCTVLPGLIEGHSHLFLHPYNERSWDDQVLKESRAERVARAVVHARKTLFAGFTTTRDLGTEGAGYDDVGLRSAIDSGIIPGPRLLVATRAIVATGSYGPKLPVEAELPLGAAEAGNIYELEKEVRTQAGKGADWIKLYADYRWGPAKESRPTFSEEEMAAAVAVAKSSGRFVAAHAGTAEGMRRAIMAGVRTIEHGDEGTHEIFELMKQKGVALCPTISAGIAVSEYRGWIPGQQPEPARIIQKKKSFADALATGVSICFGGDVGVYSHGDNAREMEAMVDYGMTPVAVLAAATSVNATVFGIDNSRGSLKSGLLADIVVVKGDPSARISDIRNVQMVIKNGIIYNVSDQIQ